MAGVEAVMAEVEDSGVEAAVVSFADPDLVYLYFLKFMFAHRALH